MNVVIFLMSFHYFFFFCYVLDLSCGAIKSDPDCCTSSEPCAIGEGGCKADIDCDGNLVCGTDNCVMFDTSWADSGYDCCTTGIFNQTKDSWINWIN